MNKKYGLKSNPTDFVKWAKNVKPNQLGRKTVYNQLRRKTVNLVRSFIFHLAKPHCSGRSSVIGCIHLVGHTEDGARSMNFIGCCTEPIRCTRRKLKIFEIEEGSKGEIFNEVSETAKSIPKRELYET